MDHHEKLKTYNHVVLDCAILFTDTVSMVYEEEIVESEI